MEIDAKLIKNLKYWGNYKQKPLIEETLVTIYRFKSSERDLKRRIESLIEDGVIRRDFEYRHILHYVK